MPTVDRHEPSAEDVLATINTEIADEYDCDPTWLYNHATKQRGYYAEVIAALEKRRGRALARLNAGGMSYRAIAEHVGISSARVQQLINKTRRYE